MTVKCAEQFEWEQLDAARPGGAAEGGRVQREHRRQRERRAGLPCLSPFILALAQRPQTPLPPRRHAVYQWSPYLAPDTKAKSREREDWDPGTPLQASACASDALNRSALALRARSPSPGKVERAWLAPLSTGSHGSLGLARDWIGEGPSAIRAPKLVPAPSPLPLGSASGSISSSSVVLFLVRRRLRLSRAFLVSSVAARAAEQEERCGGPVAEVAPPARALSRALCSAEASVARERLGEYGGTEPHGRKADMVLCVCKYLIGRSEPAKHSEAGVGQG